MRKRPSWRRWGGRFAVIQRTEAGGRTISAELRAGQAGMARFGGGRRGNGAEFSRFKLAAELYIANEVFWVICQFDNSTGLRAVSAHLLFPPSATVLCSARRG